jgi:hypothetical protein
MSTAADPVARRPGYPLPVDPAPTKKPSPPPGAKRARHKRWTRATLVVTAAVLVGFGGALAWALTSWFRESPEGERVKAARVLLRGIATQVGEYDKVYAHLPENLAKLRDPALPSLYESDPRDPWYTRIEFVPAPDGKGFRLRSYGPDKAPDTADDIVLSFADPASARAK